MHQEQVNRVRRKRRWLVVFFVALGAAISWWLWPRVDRRLVGRWDSGNGVFELHDDGEATNFYVKSIGRKLSVNGPTHWRVRVNQFQIFSPPFTLERWLTDFYEHLKFGRNPSIIFEADVVDVAPNQFVLRESGNQYTLQRIPE